ncbi:uncharacterized protein LOC124163381 [Ischnura elegans]|uniref:uncharacterized protein LOC124163381 n=1 Tax=Ischnura elegans TaxID=197161 RepID=UPI001ED8BD62|nr:uncharacterized protein LOC124163381 [Ischnura elegans]XP_046396214.1 uncharacterized protein LOC124163381 [Ischnura elegans]
MKRCLLMLLLIIELEKSGCFEDEIQEADFGQDRFADYQNHLESYARAHKILISNLYGDTSCYERVEEPLPILSRENWDISKLPVQKESTPKYVAVRDGGKHCSTAKQCAALLRWMRITSLEKPCDLRENFYIGGDGNVYEGRGWDVEPYWYLRGLRSKALTVQFLGSHFDDGQSRRHIRPFRSWLSASLLMGKLTEGFKIISMSQLLNDTKFMDENLNAIVGSWEKIIDDEQMSALWEYSIPGHLNMVYRDEWNASVSTKKLGTLTSKIKKIIISESGDGCFGQENCKLWMKEHQESLIGNYGDLFHNFYIAENGGVFEGRGWKFKAHWNLPNINNSYLSVQLIGNFTSKTPTKEAINSLKQLVQVGIKLRKVSPAHEVTSIRQLYQESNSLGSELQKYAARWVNWLDRTTLEKKFLSDETPILALIKRKDWDRYYDKYVNNRTYITIYDVVVMVDDGGKRCFTSNECMRVLETQPLRNYYIGEDGHVYEGSGRQGTEWNSIFHSDSVITVKFLGPFEQNTPLPLALRAFQSLMDHVIHHRLFSSNYINLISFRQTYKTSSDELGGLDLYLSSLKSWKNELSYDVLDESPVWANNYPIIPREGWDPRGKINSETSLGHPIEYVLIGEANLKRKTLQSLPEEEDKIRKVMSFLEDNFYVREDGWSYEGLGWNVSQNWKGAILRNNFLAVKFIGRFQNSLPTPMAMYGFRRLMRTGVSSGKLLRDYKIISTRQLFDDSLSLGDKLWEDIQTWEHWSNDSLPLFLEKADSSELTQYVQRRQWDVTHSIYRMKGDEDTLSCVVVMNTGRHCSNASECISSVREVESGKLSSLWFEPGSFYVGGDGRIYEGRGWSRAYSFHWLRYCYVVSFLGDFAKEPPSEKAIAAFNDLITMGKYYGTLEKHYKLISMREICDYSEWIGDALHDALEGWMDRQPPPEECLNHQDESQFRSI